MNKAVARLLIFILICILSADMLRYGPRSGLLTDVAAIVDLAMVFVMPVEIIRFLRRTKEELDRSSNAD